MLARKKKTSEVETLKLLQELELFQTELKAQNEELLMAVAKAETATALYNLAPSGYFTLAIDGTILQINQSGSEMLQTERSRLINSQIKLFISSSTLPIFNNFLEDTFKLKSKQHCEIQLIIHDTPSIFLHLDGNVFQNHTCLITAVDITNRKKEEEKLKRSENQFRNIFENATIGIYHSTPEGRFLKVNLKLVNMLGYTSTDELINGTTNINTQIYAEPETRPIILGAMMSKDGWVHFDKVLWRGKDGNTVILDMSSRKVLNPDGSIAYLEGIVADITAKTNSQELINQIRQNYETFFNTIDDFLFVLDEQGNITHTNTTVIDRLGYSSEELAGQSVLMVHPEERRAEAGRIVGEMLAGKSVFCPVPLITKAGNAIPVETKVKAGIWNGKPAIFGVTKDISQTKLSEEKFSKVFYLNPSACGLSDLQTGEYIEVNDAFYSLFGFTKEEVIGKTAIELGILTSETKKMILETADKSGIYSNIEADLKAKNGDIKHVLLSTENIFVQHVKL